MKLRDIYKDSNTKIFVVTNDDDENELNWTIESTDFELIPEEENIYFVRAFQISRDRKTDCYIGVMIPERIVETVVKINSSGKTEIESIYDQEDTIIPAVASDCCGDYNLYYAEENSQIGLDVLKEGLFKAMNKNIVAEDIGYIFRDEERLEEAIEFFNISEEFGPSSEYIFLELSRLYKRLGKKIEQLEYEKKFKNNGGIE